MILNVSVAYHTTRMHEFTCVALNVIVCYNNKKKKYVFNDNVRATLNAV